MVDVAYYIYRVRIIIISYARARIVSRYSRYTEGVSLLRDRRTIKRDNGIVFIVRTTSPRRSKPFETSSGDDGVDVTNPSVTSVYVLLRRTLLYVSGFRTHAVYVYHNTDDVRYEAVARGLDDRTIDSTPWIKSNERE